MQLLLTSGFLRRTAGPYIGVTSARVSGHGAASLKDLCKRTSRLFEGDKTPSDGARLVGHFPTRGDIVLGISVSPVLLLWGAKSLPPGDRSKATPRRRYGICWTKPSICRAFAIRCAPPIGKAAALFSVLFMD
jgi:hypothetical protein